MIVYATFGRRLWATLLSAVIDLLVLGAMSMAVDGDRVLAPFGFWFLLHHVGLTMEGGDLGHRLAGLRVVRTNGEPVGLLHAVMREIGRLFVSPLPMGFGLLWMLDQPQRRTWHDLMAGTVVVRERTDALAPAWAAAPPWRHLDEDEAAAVVPVDQSRGIWS